MSSTATRTRPRRWIAAEIENLDPATDYEEIWRLTSSYGLNDFALKLVYAHLFPHFYLPPHGSQPLWDGGGGKVVERAGGRCTGRRWERHGCTGRPPGWTARWKPSTTARPHDGHLRGS